MAQEITSRLKTVRLTKPECEPYEFYWAIWSSRVVFVKKWNTDTARHSDKGWNPKYEARDMYDKLIREGYKAGPVEAVSYFHDVWESTLIKWVKHTLAEA